MKTQLIVGIILLVVAGLIAKYKIFDDKVELKYSLSERIPSDFSDLDKDIGIQQLTLKNSGNLSVNEITIKINSHIVENKIKKFRSTDSIKITSKANYFELLYPELPPEGEIIILLKSSDRGINYSDIEIYHDKGIAKEVFSKNSRTSNWVFLFLSFIYIILTIESLRKSLVENVRPTSNYAAEKALRRKKPWHVSEKSWNEIRHETISKFLFDESIFNIEKSKAYITLNSEKPEYINDEEWIICKEQAEEKIQRVIIDKLYNSFLGSNIEELSNIKKPKHFSYNNWEELYNKISRGYCIIKVRDLLNIDSTLYLENNFTEVKPKAVTDEDWNKLVKTIENHYSSLVIHSVTDWYEYESLHNNFNFAVLSESSKQKLNSFIEKIKEINSKVKYYDLLLNSLREIFVWKEIPEKPKEIDSIDWEKLIDLYQHSVEANQHSIEQLNESLRIKDEFFPAREKITKQLELIDNILNNPNSIYKIEDYNIPFEKDNWKNLKLLAENLIKIKS